MTSRKVSELDERLNKMAGKGDLPPGMLPMQRGMYGMTLQIMLLDLAAEDKTKPPETVNAELDKMRTESHMYDEISEVLRLRQWFMEHDKLENLVPKLCYTSDRNQIERDLEEKHAELKRTRPKQPPDSQLEGSTHD